MEQSQRISQVIEEYDSQGWHRSGTNVDHSSANWLCDRLRAIGVPAELERFDLLRVDPDLCYLQVGDEIIEGLPLFDGSFTDSNGVYGLLGNIESSSDIAVIEVSRGAGGQADMDKARRSGKHKAVLAITMGDSPGLMATNASDFHNPFGPPVLQVSSEYRDLLMTALSSQQEAKLFAASSRTDTYASNVVGLLPGKDRTLAPLVVMTPRSGWWHCASERGGGLSCLLEVMSYLVNTGSPRDVICLATSAHELGFYGIHAFLKGRPGFVKNSFGWIHFGANIGASTLPGLRFSASSDDLARQVEDNLMEYELGYAIPAGDGVTVGGESQEIARQGGYVTALVGGNALFHIETDRWPHAVDVEVVKKAANAYSDLASKLVRNVG